MSCKLVLASRCHRLVPVVSSGIIFYWGPRSGWVDSPRKAAQGGNAQFKCIVVKWIDVVLVFSSWLHRCRLRGDVQADRCCWQRLRRYLHWNQIAFLGPAQPERTDA